MGYSFDEDEYETVSTSRPCTSCNGDMKKCGGGCNGMASFGLRRRDPKDIARIRAARQLDHENRILAEADAIRARRGS